MYQFPAENALFCNGIVEKQDETLTGATETGLARIVVANKKPHPSRSR
jgi:hypothetical protein